MQITDRPNHRAHFHITIGDCTTEELKRAARLVKGKPTPIDLELEAGSRRERMITVHQRGLSTFKMLSCVRLLTNMGIEVVRYKLEADIEDFAPGLPPVSAKNYCEFHVRIPVDCATFSLGGWVRSRNPSKAGYVFLNSRAFDGKELHTRFHQIEWIQGRVSDTDIHMEWTVFDSNSKQDEDWISGPHTSPAQ